jgi:hypothetical protein
MDTQKVKSYALHYLYGLVASSFNGAVTSVIAFLGLAGGAAAGVNVPAMNLKQLAVVFVSSILVNALMYFQRRPIPEDFPDQQVIPTGPKETVTVQPANIITQQAGGPTVEPKT